MDTDTPDRRRLLAQAAATLALAAPVRRALAQAEPGPAMTRPPITRRTPGKPGDFNFLEGRWKIANQQLRDGRWEHFEGEARCLTILDGVGSVEELRIPSRHFSGMGLRLLDVKQQLWSDHWVNAKSGVVTTPGLLGSFEDGAGIFEDEDEADGQKVKLRAVWDRISATTCRWQQGSSRDGGRSWQVAWSMDWSRVA